MRRPDAIDAIVASVKSSGHALPFRFELRLANFEDSGLTSHSSLAIKGIEAVECKGFSTSNNFLLPSLTEAGRLRIITDGLSS
jgi:hypothetical protein